jgi:hypothetical protein
MEEERSKSPTGLIVALFVLAVPVLYVLSIGPVAYLSSSGTIRYDRRDAAEGFYAPLFWASENCEPFDHALERYIQLWVK